MANFRSYRLGMPYGDQGIFVRDDLFRAVGGYPERPIMEDFDLVRTLRKRGRISCVPFAVKTSARRWKQLGPVKAVLINQALILAHLAGVSPKRIARRYGREL